MSTTTNLKLFKHDNPTTNTNQFDVEKALNENWDKLDANAGEIANKIQALENTTNAKDTSQDTEIEVLKAENALLKSQIPSATVVGETIHLEDSSNMQCQISPIGASKQDTREGYNYLDVANLIAQGCTITWENDILTISSNDVAHANGYIDITHLFKDNSGKQLYFDYEAISATITGASSLVQLIIGYNDGTSTSYQELVRADYGKRPYTIPADTSNIKSCRVCIYSNNYAELNGEQTTTITKPILQFGTETKEYEQYGASPSIEHEAPIESVGDNINLFNIETVTVNTYINHETGKTATSSSSITSDYIEIKANESITIVYDYEALQNTSNRGIAFYNENKTFLSGTTYTSTKKETTIIPNQNGYMRLCYDNNCTNVKVVQGSKATQYSPYGQGSIEIYNCNENICDGEFERGGYGSDGSISTSLTMMRSVNYLNVKELTQYAISYEKVMSTAYCNRIVYFDKYHNILAVENSTIESFVTPKNCKYIKICFYSGSPSTNITLTDIYNVQVGIGTATKYVPHQSQTKALYTQQPFRAIGDVKDRFVKQNGVWYEEHNTNKYEMTGIETWTKHTTTNNNAYYFMITNYMNDIPASTINNDFMSAILCSHFKTEVVNTFVFNDMQGAGLGTVTSAGQANFFIGTGLNGISTIEELKAWVTEQYTKGKPLTIYYALKTPILIPCTPEQLEILESFYTYKNITNISSDSIGELEVFYYKDLETLLGGV